MWLIVRAVVVVPGVRVLGATFDDGKEIASKSGGSGSVIVEGTGLRLRSRGPTARPWTTSLPKWLIVRAGGLPARVGNGALPVLPKAMAGSNQNLAAMATVVL